MTIQEILSFLDSHTVAHEKNISERDIADMRNVVSDYLRTLPKEQHEERWRVKSALYMAELFCESFHEVYLADEFKTIKKLFTDVEEDVLSSLKNNSESKHVCTVQLATLYKLFEYYVQRMKHVAELRGYRMLQGRFSKEAKLLYERYILHSSKQSLKRSLSFYQVVLRRKFKKHYYIYAIFSGVGVVAFWHGFWGIFDILGLHPFSTAVFGITILVLTGVLMHEFLGMKGTRKGWADEDSKS